MRSQVLAPSGMTWSKRLRASLPVIIVVAAFIGYTVLIMDGKPFRVYDDPNATTPRSWPATGIFWGLSRIRSAGYELPWYVAGPTPAESRGTAPGRSGRDGN